MNAIWLIAIKCCYQAFSLLYSSLKPKVTRPWKIRLSKWWNWRADTDNPYYSFQDTCRKLFLCRSIGHINQIMIFRGKMGQQWGSNFNIRIYREKSLKNLLFKNRSARKADTCVEASSGNVDSTLLKLWSPGLGLARMGDQNLHKNI